jgi:geranylgeranyl diphosphate synthase type I
MGAICAKKPKDAVNLASFGKNLGVSFQITDDYIGILGDPKITKKPVGNDLREGKKSLPILLAIQKADPKSRKIILKVFGNPRATKLDIAKAIDVMRRLQIEQEVREAALDYVQKAKQSLAKYSSPAKSEMITLLDFIVTRSL